MNEIMLLRFLVTVLLFNQPVDTLVLRSGHTLSVAGAITVENERAVFRQPDGTLYSLPLQEIDVVATEELAESKQAEKKSAESRKKPKEIQGEVDRILKKLEANQPRFIPPDSGPDQTPNTEVEVTARHDELYWRSESRRLEENRRRKQEDLELLLQREDQLEEQIRGLYSLFGHDPRALDYHVYRLQRTQEAIERAELDLQRAERALEQFLEEARRLDILPGWLRE